MYIKIDGAVIKFDNVDNVINIGKARLGCHRGFACPDELYCHECPIHEHDVPIYNIIQEWLMSYVREDIKNGK